MLGIDNYLNILSSCRIHLSGTIIFMVMQVSYWFGGRKKHVYTQLISTEHCQTSTFEQDPVSLPVGISMLRLRKVSITML